MKIENKKRFGPTNKTNKSHSRRSAVVEFRRKPTLASPSNNRCKNGLAEKSAQPIYCMAGNLRLFNGMVNSSLTVVVYRILIGEANTFISLRLLHGPQAAALLTIMGAALFIFARVKNST
ncbi:MAG: hypothetical protein R3A44_01195 [Caldilineaceae bacterium]